MISNILIDFFIDHNDNAYVLKEKRIFKEFSVKNINLFVNNNYK